MSTRKEIRSDDTLRGGAAGRGPGDHSKPQALLKPAMLSYDRRTTPSVLARLIPTASPLHHTSLPPTAPPPPPLALGSSSGAPLADIAQQLVLEDELALLVLLAALVRLVVLPPHRGPALPAQEVADNVPARRHVALLGGRRRHVDDAVEEVGLTGGAAEVLFWGGV